MSNKKYKLQILMPSYNKEKYIEEAINSVLKQNTNFDFQIIVTDDGSTDKTFEIVNKYINEYPNKIVFLPSKTNQGLLSNIIKAYKYMNCEYFACLDADDYLIDFEFYQKAIDYLDNNKDFNIYASNTSILDKNGNIQKQNTSLKDNFIDSDFNDMLSNKAILGNSISSVFRNCIINQDLINFLEKYVGSDKYTEHSYREDDFRNRIHLEKGKCHFVNEIVGIYRSTDTGLYQSSSFLKKINLKINAYIDMYYFFEKKYSEFIKLAINESKRYIDIIQNNFNNIFNFEKNDIIKFFEIIIKLNEFDKNFFNNFICDIKNYTTIMVKKKNFSFLQKIFSITNDRKKTHKVITILGIKIKIKRKKRSYWERRFDKYGKNTIYDVSNILEDKERERE